MAIPTKIDHGALRIDGSKPVTGTLDMGSQNIDAADAIGVGIDASSSYGINISASPACDRDLMLDSGDVREILRN